MVNKQFFEEISQSLLSLLPAQVKETEQVLKDAFQSLLTQAFSTLDLVTREEFDVQVKVLTRTREKVDALQEQIDHLLEEKNKKES